MWKLAKSSEADLLEMGSCQRHASARLLTCVLNLDVVITWRYIGQLHDRHKLLCNCMHSSSSCTPVSLPRRCCSCCAEQLM